MTYPSGSRICSAIELARRPWAWMTEATPFDAINILVPVAPTEVEVNSVRPVIVRTDL